MEMTREEIIALKQFWDILNNYEVIPIINNQEEINLIINTNIKR